MGAIPKTDYCVRLGALLPFYDIELHFVTLFEGLVPIQLNG